MPNQIQNSNFKREYDLLERTGKFGEDIIEFAKSIPDNTINRPLITQLVKSGTSVGANYEEVDGALSKRDFMHKNRYLQKRIERIKALVANDS